MPVARRRWRSFAPLLLLLPALLSAAPSTRSRHGSRKPAAQGLNDAALAKLSLEDALSRVADRAPARTKGLSVQIAELDSGKVVLERNPQQPETVASVTKMFSTAAALHFLGPSYKFKTTLWRRGDIKEGLLQGSLLVVGGGDPNISGRFYNDDYNYIFDRWAEGLKRAGILRVGGDLILNSSFFDSVSRHPEWPAGQEAKWYQAPISALSYNDNVVLVEIHPGAHPGQRAIASVEPANGIVHAICSARTSGRLGRPRVGVMRLAGSSAITVSGSVPSRGAWWSTPIAIDDAVGFFGSALKTRLEVAGIPLGGELVEKSIKPDNSWVLVASTESDLMPTLAVINKRSQGYYAEQVFKTLAAEKTGKGSWDNAVALEKQFFTALGLDPSRYDLHDGSGLSPQDQVAAADVIAFLQATSKQPYGAAWKATLATPGDPDSTLRHRLREPELAGRINAKTGSIASVSTLAGYVTADSGKTYAFAILLNGRGVWDSSGHAYQDRLLRLLIKKG
ncbi:MAG TPA: D-alanyl-D-alanine carboxypeptidase/D-alanyl-D-alanine-endopeptidase [Thermoanaerobaculia bacterium]|nr:D-alanyl-D-alanine carboxypeptidase/D-alanyl-D-alanine-endopeptidase [Thermoanaerobaculia bacterium]